MADESSDKQSHSVPRRALAAWGALRRTFRARWVLPTALCVLFVTLLLGCLLVFPQFFVDRTITLHNAPQPSIADRLSAENGVRATLLQGFGAFVVLAGAFTAWRRLQATLDRNREELRLNREQFQAALDRTREELNLSREGQVTERFTRAIEHLGSSTLDVRLGGIYALERIAKDSARDHGPIMEVLTALVREDARWQGDQEPARGKSTKAPADILAILTVLRRRASNAEEPDFDLSQTNLRGADLREARLERADFHGANLEGADLRGAHLEAAYLARASLSRAHLEDADLHDAHLEEADLRGADLGGANLRSADLTRADLRGAHLGGADFRRAHLCATHLEGVDLRWTDLEEADFDEAYLERAILGEGTFDRVLNLTWEQIESTVAFEGGDPRGAPGGGAH